MRVPPQSHFDNAFFKGDVMNFMTAQDEALRKIFGRYAKGMSSSSSSSRTTSDGSGMAIDQFCQFCIDYNVVPALVSQEALMGVLRDIAGRKLTINFTEFLRLLGKLAETIYVDEEVYGSLLSKVEALFHEIDRAGSIFKLSKKRQDSEKARRTSTIGKLQSVSNYKKGGTGVVSSGKAPVLDSVAKETRVSALNSKRMSNVNKMFMLK